jgi:hypothetical protein
MGIAEEMGFELVIHALCLLQLLALHTLIYWPGRD